MSQPLPHSQYLPAWSWVLPLLAALVLGVSSVIGLPTWGAVALGLALGASVLSAVHHAEVVAHRVGEPFGTLVLALAVTVIEVALIASMMLTGEDRPTVARDTVFAAVMICANGIVGLCLVLGGLRHHQTRFRIDGTHSALAVLVALTGLTLVMPAVTTTTDGPTFSPAQLVFAGGASLLLYAVFVFVQTMRHRDFFLPEEDVAIVRDAQGGAHAAPPSNAVAWVAFGVLLVCLVAVVGLAKALAPTIEWAVSAAGAPQAVVGVAIALLVLAPEGWAAVRSALANRMQVSLNLAIGSALATIGLTIPAVAAISLITGKPLVLGLVPKDLVLLFLTTVLATLTLGSGRATVLQGAVHLVLFAAFLLLTVVP
jgi:Ca2+:H+ antiporter